MTQLNEAGLQPDPQHQAAVQQAATVTTITDVSDPDADVDLEIVVHTEGTSWADKPESLGLAQAVNTNKESWADLVAADRRCFADVNAVPLNNVNSVTHSDVNTGTSIPNGEMQAPGGGNLTLQHKAEVPLVFVAYKRFSQEGKNISDADCHCSRGFFW